MTLLCIYFDEKIQLAPIIGAVIAAIIVIIGWFIIAYLNRKNEIAKELRQYKLKLLADLDELKNSALEYSRNSEFPQWKKEFLKLSNEVNIAFLSFCNEEEIKLYFLIELKYNILSDQTNATKYIEGVQKCKILLLNNFRKKLKLNIVDYKKLINA